MSIKIDKSLFSEEELRAYEALIAKATVDPEKGEEEMEEQKPPMKMPLEKEDDFVEEEFDEEDDFMERRVPEKKSCGTKKASSTERALKSALTRLDKLQKSYEMKEFTDIAKKYAPLGEDEAELANTLYEMKKSSEDNYNKYIEALDKSLGFVEKSGLFAEIGKSGYGYSGSSTTGKIDTIAAEIMKSDTGLTYEQAVVKAWDTHPELVAEYDKEYGRK